MFKGQIKQKYSARHLSPTNRTIFTLMKKTQAQQLSTLIRVNREVRHISGDGDQPTYFRNACHYEINAR